MKLLLLPLLLLKHLLLLPLLPLTLLLLPLLLLTLLLLPLLLLTLLLLPLLLPSNSGLKSIKKPAIWPVFFHLQSGNLAPGKPLLLLSDSNPPFFALQYPT
ncbi:hypothetical protein SKTS_10720 [Sulfurimicrobium lacus]|uniref:Uncharacterized protein n=1 Tax=Sulfurimicrobium lacus TaxID=2715678 RepID=A0A6F8VB05_9PROT|nr:hypothetical protein SKTS_10720 [Sulfurimicrobium lacus]